MRRKGSAQPWWGGQHRDIAYQHSVDAGLHGRSLRAKLRAVSITWGACSRCYKRGRLYDGHCYCCRQHAGRHSRRVVPLSKRRRWRVRGRMP